MPRPKRAAGDSRRPDDIVDAYLAAQYGVGLEQVLLDATYGNQVPALAGAVTTQAQKVGHRWYADSGLAENFEGTLTLLSVAYAFKCEAYSVPEAYVHRLLTNVSAFDPVDWIARAQVGDGA
jgi:hypothetical protein